ncbi:ankyrin repeat and SOCS box protein 2-like isoform X2 [Sardina pilchardus]|uniref:ankyrin repeat and SOCS box protein 2-like isoform X2 n=1 Tax=Sardina pilchardus TaxID=27697 RepID=UPI002E13FC86
MGKQSHWTARLNTENNYYKGRKFHLISFRQSPQTHNFKQTIERKFIMAATSRSMAVSSRNVQALEDYSMYNNMSDDDLMQLAIERSLSDICSASSGFPQPATQRSSYSHPAANQSVPSEDGAVPAFQQGSRTQAAVPAQNIPPCTNPWRSVNLLREGGDETDSDEEDGLRTLSWTGTGSGLEVTVTRVKDMTALNAAIFRNDAPKVLEILHKEPYDIICAPNEDGWIHLHLAALCGFLECLTVLLKAFPDLINKCTNTRHTPLSLAVECKHLLCTQSLLQAGANPNIANDAGETPLYRACEHATEEMVGLLLMFGAKVSQASLEGVTPLHEAVRNKNIVLCKLLVRAGANIRARTCYGSEPLFMAGQTGNTEALELLIKHGAYIDCQANDGATSLYEASKNGHEEVVMLLLSKNADVNRRTKAGLTPLHIAAKNGHSRVVSLLIPHTNRRVMEKSAISPLHLAAEHDREEVMDVLINADFDVNTVLKSRNSQICDDRCLSALHFTIRNSNIDAASMLLEAGADPNLDIFNPLLVAVRQGNKEMVSLLVKYGANVNACVPTHPTTFPGALLFCMKYTPMFKFLLDNGCDANACFSCVYGDNTHPPVQRRHATDELDLDPHSETTQFCEIIADPLYTYWVGPILDRLLDYTGSVKLCSRITELLESNKDWEHIKEKSRPPACLMHLCRLRTRQLVGWERMRKMTSLPLPGRLIKYLLYIDNESEDFLSHVFD